MKTGSGERVVKEIDREWWQCSAYDWIEWIPSLVGCLCAVVRLWQNRTSPTCLSLTRRVPCQSSNQWETHKQKKKSSVTSISRHYCLQSHGLIIIQYSRQIKIQFKISLQLLWDFLKNSSPHFQSEIWLLNRLFRSVVRESLIQL